jgi:hypothetical protein
MSIDPATTLRVPVCSDPKWLRSAVLGMTAGASGIFMALFARTNVSAALGALPGMTVGVFGGSALAAWARRRGGTISLVATPGRLDVSDEDRRVEVVDLTSPYGALLLAGSGRRVLILSQHNDPVVLIETLAPDAALTPAWEARTVKVDLDAVALSAATSHAFALLPGQSLAPMLAHLEATLEADAPWILQPTGTGVLTLTRGALALADRAPLRDPIHPLNYAVKVQGGQVAGLGLASTQDEGSMILLACDEATVARRAVTTDNPIDAFIPMSTYEVLRALYRDAPRG